MIENVLILCLGNICRSPAAEAMLRDRLRQKGLFVVVHSAGLTAVRGARAHSRICALLYEKQISLDGHVAAQVTPEMVHVADLILVMDDEQKQMLEGQFNAACGKTFRLGHYQGFDIEDPFGKSKAVFSAAIDKIELSLNDWVELIA